MSIKLKNSVITSKIIVLLLFGLITSIRSFGQLNISGPTNVVTGTSYSYTPSYNGSNTYFYNGSYSYTITGGVVSGTSNTSKSGSCNGGLYTIGINVTWTSSAGSLSLSCGLGNKTIVIAAPPPLSPGSVTPTSQAINYNTIPTQLTGTAATGGATSPSYSYQWMSGPDGVNWTNISGATSTSYVVPALTATTYFRRKVTETTTTTVGYTNTSLVTVYPQVAATISPATQNIFVGSSSATMTASPSGGNGTYSYQWQTSPNNTTWTNKATTSSYSPGVINALTYVRLIVTSNGVSVTSNTATINTCVAPAGQISGITQCVVGSTMQLVSSISGGTWSSNNTAIATIDGNGVVTGKTNGNCVISYTVTSACATTSIQLGITVVPFSVIEPTLGSGVQDPITTDTISLSQGSVKTSQFRQDTLSSAAHTIKNVVSLQILEESTKYIPKDFIATVVLKIEYGHSSSTISQIDSMKLSVSYNKGQSTKYEARNYFEFNGAEYSRVTVLRIDTSVSAGVSGFDIKQVLLLTNSLAASRYYVLANNKVPVVSYTNPVSGSVPDELQINWLYPSGTMNNSSQVEWAWVPNNMTSGYIKNNVFDTSLLFKTNSSRIDIPGGAVAGTYKVPLLYGDSGRLYVRVRGVNVMPSGSRSDGPWSGVQTYAFNGHNNSLNWQANTSFAEEGKRKSVIQYFDGSLRTRQTVTKDNTTSKTIVSESIYDGQGRAAVQVLPSPGISNILAYTKNLNKFNAQPDNSDPTEFFDITSSTYGKYSTAALDSSFGASRYYSKLNADSTNPDYSRLPAAGGFPFTVTRYTPDNTGRIMRQGGVGDSLQIGGEHATNYYYGSPSQESLNALFGTEVGNYTHYFKIMVQDANGQMSVSYVDMHGRTIATALAGNSPSMMEALPINDTMIYKNQAGKVITQNLLDKGSNILKGNSLESINSLLVPFQTLYTFNYHLDAQTLQMPKCGGGTVGYPCKFDVEISIGNEAGDTAAVMYSYKGVSNLDATPSLILKPGSYNIRKTLTLNQDSLQAFMQQYNSVNVGLCRTQQNIIDSIASADSTTSGCGIVTTLTSVGCLATLGNYSTYLLNYATSLGDSSVNQLTSEQVLDIRNQYVKDSIFCKQINPNISNTLVGIREQMLADMVPFSGQYALEDGTGSMYNKYNIFSATGSTFSQPFYKYPRQSQIGSPDYYFTTFGTIDSTVLLPRLQSMTKSDFESEFVNSWANSLLPYHPEFNKLKLAEDSLRSSYNFIDSVNTNVANAFNPISSDPFFITFAPTTDKNVMKKYSDTAWQSGLSMWQMAYAEGFGCNSMLDTTQRKNCLNYMPKIFTATNSSVNNGVGVVTLTSTIQSRAWELYRGFYSVVRGDMVSRFINIHAPQTDTIDNRALLNGGFKLHFPYNNVQQAENLGWTAWYPDKNGNYPVVNIKDSVAKASNNCDSYVGAWRTALLDCPELASDTVKREIILNSITGKLLDICKKGTDAANPFGSSTVAQLYSGNTFTSFEQAVKFVLDSAGITTNLYCHPYRIDFPKPYGKNPIMSRQYTSQIDTCQTALFVKLKTQAKALGYDSASLTSINAYFKIQYNDTIPAGLYQGLMQSQTGKRFLYNCRDSTWMWLGHPMTGKVCDTLFGNPLASAQNLPNFLNCGFDSSSYICLNCSAFKSLDSAFNVLFGRHPVFTGSITNDTTILYNDLFAQYVNFKTGLSKTWQYYAQQMNATSCGIGGLSGLGKTLAICRDHIPWNDTTGYRPAVTACDRVRMQAAVKGSIIYNLTSQKVIDDFQAAYLTKLLSAQETFKVTDTVKEYHYTLYYYDQAGNLIKTVPPKGVNPIYRQSWIDSVETARANGTILTPVHLLVTRYNYNSLNQVVLQKTPDAGSSRFYYDRLGRLAISQNARQAGTGNVYSYTQYDTLGRITQVGQITGNSAMSDATAKNPSGLQSWYTAAASTRNQITLTVYDTAYGPTNGVNLVQQNLRNRVSYTQLINNATAFLPSSGSYYSYDIHGNVDTLMQDFGSSLLGVNPMNDTNVVKNPTQNRFKKIVYNYDLISAKVKQVSYQPGQWDSYYHRYTYDAENRLIDVHTGRDSVMLILFPEREASYRYFNHGPLARTVLGKLQVQGLDYAYTLQGWLKAINPVMGGTLTNGTDSIEASPVAQDVYGFSLHYYKNDYRSIKNNPQTSSVFSVLGTNGSPLFNGNIGAMAVNIPKLGSPMVYDYQYDQLNRLVAMNAMPGVNGTTGVFTFGNSNKYKEQINYDANGNILTYLRNGDSSTRMAMDNLTYFYKPNTNQLHKVTDVAPDASGGTYSQYNDLKTGQVDNNYQYDQIGNLVSDVSESITNIVWNVYGKIQSMTKAGQQIEYAYDPAGNRIRKYTSTDTTFYVRDASGNVLSVYTKGSGPRIQQTETHLYGSSRLGLAGLHAAVGDTIQLNGGFGWGYGRTFTRGEKRFELSNHLGNVLATVSDRRYGLDANSDGTVESYTADVGSANDYYPFGMLMPGRRGYAAQGGWASGSSAGSSLPADVTLTSRAGNQPGEYVASNSVELLPGFESGTGDTFTAYIDENGGSGSGNATQGNGFYRYGFNGKENDNEIKANGNEIAFEARIYDPRLGRFLSCDPLEKTYPWQSTYVFAHNNPIKLIDVMGMGGGDPTPVYHRTSSGKAASISQNGFDPGKSNRNGFTFFSTTPEAGSIGTTAASGNTVVNGTIDVSSAKTISKQQMTGWFNDGLVQANKQLNTSYSSMSAVPAELRGTYQRIADGVRNTKLADFMKADGGGIYNIPSKNTIAVAEMAINSVKITGLSGSGAADAINLISRPAMNGEAAAALARYGQAASTIKWGGRACIAIAVASDLYEIYQSNNTLRTVNIKVGGWAGALAGASYGAGVGGGGGTLVPGAGNLAGAIGGGVIGGIVGYWAGSTVTQFVNDYLFTPGVNSK